jgi:molybdopterin-biosynthesis enzyme MoeA-like protein
VKINLPEGTIAEPLTALQARYPDLEIGSYPAFRQGKVMTSLVLRGTEEARLVAAAEELAGILRQLGGEPSIEAA